MVFRQLIRRAFGILETFQSLWSRAGSFDIQRMVSNLNEVKSQSLWSRAGSFDKVMKRKCKICGTSQSLWSRAGSFDNSRSIMVFAWHVSIPLEQGRVFRPVSLGSGVGDSLSQSLWSRAGSFDESKRSLAWKSDCLNPFGTGRGLSTEPRELQGRFYASQSL